MLPSIFQTFTEPSPICVMARAVLENLFEPDRLDALFDKTARNLYTRLQQSLQRDLLLNLSDGFLYDCLDWKVRQTDMPGYRQWTLDNFSGTLCVDERSCWFVQSAQ